MRQYILPESWDGSSLCLLNKKEAHRLLSVLKLGSGDSFPAIAANGKSYECTISEVKTRGLCLLVKEAENTNTFYIPDVRKGNKNTMTSPAVKDYAYGLPRISIGLSLLKGNKLDEAVRSATEAGVQHIFLLEAQRSIPKDSNKSLRLKRISSEALSQSGSKIATTIEGPMSISAFIKNYPIEEMQGLGLYLHEQAIAQSSVHEYCSLMAEEFCALVGPEGGFAPEELQLFDNAGYKPLWLGPGVFRAETAAVFLVASLRIVLLERSLWSMKK